MRKFEISLRVTPEYETDGVEMIPMKMGKTPPKRYDDFSRENTLHLRWEAGYLPNNLVHRLMIRKYAELDPDRGLYEKCVWRTGGWFRSTDGGCDALVEMTDKALDVYVRGGREARVYLDSFRQQILHILRELGMEAKEWVFCTVHGKTGKIPYEHVMKRRRRGKKEIYLGDIDEDVSIETLLYENYVNEGARLVLDTRDFFISYNNGHDGQRAAWIARTLRDAGYSVHFQADDCTGGMSFPAWMAEAIRCSRGFVAVWSGAYEDSPYCRDELNAAYVRRNRDTDYFLLPVRAEDVPVRNSLFAHIVHTDLLSDDEAQNRAALLKAVEHFPRWNR